MEFLSQILQQAQRAVLCSQRDLATLRSELSEQGGAAVNPFLIDLQTTIQQRQEAAAQMLGNATNQLLEIIGDLDSKAAALGNVCKKEKELQVTKKSMQRYFEAHTKLRDEQRTEYEGLLSLHEAQREHLEEGAVSRMRSASNEGLMHRVLHRWLKRAMLRSFSQQFVDQESSLTECHVRLSAHLATWWRGRTFIRSVLRRWEHRLLRRQRRRLEEEVQTLEEAASFFRQECATTQRLLSRQLSEEHTKMLHSSGMRTRECELLDDEVSRLRASLEELTGEFSKRTETYVRQQDEVEHFFTRKEQKLRDALAEALSAVERGRHQHNQSLVEANQLFDYLVEYAASAQRLCMEYVARKEAAFTAVSTVAYAGMVSRTLALHADVTELKQQVALLAPLSEKVLRLDNELAAASACLDATREESNRLRDALRQAEGVHSILTDRVALGDAGLLRSKYILLWMGVAVQSTRQHLRDDLERTKATLQDTQRTYLLQQQQVTTTHRELVWELEAKIDTGRLHAESLQKELQSVGRTLRETEASSAACKVEHIHLVAAYEQLERSQQAMEEALQQSSWENFGLQETVSRTAVEVKELRRRHTLLHGEALRWQDLAESRQRDIQDITAVCEEWSHHCESEQKKRIAAINAHQRSTASILQRFNARAHLTLYFHTWRAVGAEARKQQSLCDLQHRLHAEHVTEIRDLKEQHREEVQRIEAQHATTVSQLKIMHIAERHSTDARQEHTMEVLLKRHTALQADRQVQSRNYDLAVAQAKSEHDKMQRNLDEVGSLVVEYCARYAFTTWKGWWQLRRIEQVKDDHRRTSRRDAKNIRGLMLRADQWMITYHNITDEAYTEQWRAFGEAVSHVMRINVGYASQLAAMAEHQALLEGLLANANTASTHLEAQNADLRQTLRRLDVKSQSERAEADCLNNVLSHVNEVGRTQRLYYDRTLRLWHRLQAISDDHFYEVLSVFGEATVSLWQHMEPLRCCPVVRQNSVTSHRSVGTATCWGTDAIVPTALHTHSLARLRRLDEVTRPLSDGVTDTPTTTVISELLRTPIVLSEPFCGTDWEVYSHALEVLRYTAVQLLHQSCSHSRSPSPTVQRTNRPPSRRTSLHEMQPSDLWHGSNNPTSDVETGDVVWEDCQCEGFHEGRLGALIAEYQAVLEAFRRSLESRRDTFYAVNGILSAAETFSDTLLERFTENAAKMQALRRGCLMAVGTASAGTSPLRGVEGKWPDEEESGSQRLVVSLLTAFSGDQRGPLRELLEPMDSAPQPSHQSLVGAVQLPKSTAVQLSSREQQLESNLREVERRVRWDGEMMRVQHLEEVGRLEWQVASLVEALMMLQHACRDERIMQTYVSQQLRCTKEEVEQRLALAEEALGHEVANNAQHVSSLEAQLQDTQRRVERDSELALSRQKEQLEIHFGEKLALLDRKHMRLQREHQQLAAWKVQSEGLHAKRREEEHQALESLIQTHQTELTKLELKHQAASHRAQRLEGQLRSTTQWGERYRQHQQALADLQTTTSQEKTNYALEMLVSLRVALPPREPPCLGSWTAPPTISPVMILFLDSVMLSLDMQQEMCILFAGAFLRQTEEGRVQLMETLQAAQVAQCAIEAENMQLRERLAVAQAESSVISHPTSPDAGAEERLQAATPQPSPPDTPTVPHPLLPSAATPMETQGLPLRLPVAPRMPVKCEARPASSSQASSGKRSLSVDSLQISCNLVRYSMHLNEHSDRTTMRLQRAQVIGSEVDSLVTRARQVREMVKAEGLPTSTERPLRGAGRSRSLQRLRL